MKRVGVREFKHRATALIAEEEALVIERHGKPVGLYLPLPKKDKETAREAAKRLEGTIERILTRTGLSRNAFEAAWDEAGKRD